MDHRNPVATAKPFGSCLQVAETRDKSTILSKSCDTTEYH